MSRHSLQGGDTRVFVGWDSPMRTFFFQVYDLRHPPDDYDTPDLVAGAEYGECDSAAPMLEAMEGQCEGRGITLPPEYDRAAVVRLLDEDRLVAQPRTPHQREVERMLTGEDPPEEALRVL